MYEWVYVTASFTVQQIVGYQSYQTSGICKQNVYCISYNIYYSYSSYLLTFLLYLYIYIFRNKQIILNKNKLIIKLTCNFHKYEVFEDDYG